MFWSAGLVVHPDFIADTKSYLNRKKMNHNVHLWPLSLFPNVVLSPVFRSFRLLTEGESYTVIIVVVFLSDYFVVVVVVIVVMVVVLLLLVIFKIF